MPRFPVQNATGPSRNKVVAFGQKPEHYRCMFRIQMFSPVLLLSAVTMNAQVADLRAAWTTLGANLVAAANRLPEADYSFRPTPDVRSFAQLVAHIAESQFAFCGPLSPLKSRAGVDKLTTKAELVAALRDSVTFCSAAANVVTDANSAQTVKLFGQDKARLTVLWTNLAHSNEHYGNMVTYLRLKGLVPPTSDPPKAGSKLYFDLGHGEWGARVELAEVAESLNLPLVMGTKPITAEALKNVRVLYLGVPITSIGDAERDAVIAFVRRGGSLLVIAEEQVPVASVNEVITPFGLKFTPETPYLHNGGAIAKAGDINAADRELPFTGGRAVEGGTPFAYQLDRAGNAGPVFGASRKVEGGGRIVAMAEGMASVFAGTKEGVRLSGKRGDVQGTVFWGKDSGVFMREVIAWLMKNDASYSD